MLSIKLFLIILPIVFIGSEGHNTTVKHAEEPKSNSTGLLNVTFLGWCDRITLKGVMECVYNYLPDKIFHDGNGHNVCCAYSKYQTCVRGLSDSLKSAFEQAKCPSPYKSLVIMAFGDNVVGVSMKHMCNQSKEKDPCAK